MEEAEAITRLKQGDIGGLEPLVRRHYVVAVRAAYLVTQDRALAEDLVQAAFVRAYERIDQFDSRRPFGPWFLRGVVRDATKSRARQSRQVPWDINWATSKTSATPADPGPGPEALLERAETRAEVWAALALLPPEQRAVVVQRYYLDWSEAESARALAVPAGTVKWRLHAARQRLRALLRSG